MNVNEEWATEKDLTAEYNPTLRKEIERLTVLNRELENQYVLSNAILESIADVLDGSPVSDFMESFPVVREVLDLRNSLILEREDSALREKNPTAEIERLKEQILK